MMKNVLNVTALTICVLSTIIGGTSVLTPTAVAHDYKAGKIKIDHPWARPSLGAVKNGAAYLVLENKGDADDRLLSVTADIANRLSLHETKVEDGMATMQALGDGIEIPGNATVPLKPGGKHVMLFGLKKKLVVGESFPLTLTFEKAGKVDVVVKIEEPQANSGEESDPHMDHSKHHGDHGDHGGH